YEGFHRQHRSNRPQIKAGKRMISGDPHAGANPAVLNSDVVGLGTAVETLHKGLHASLILQHLQVDNVVPADFGKFPPGQAGLDLEGNRNSEVGTRGCLSSTRKL